MLDVEGEIIDESFERFNRFTCDNGQLISRVLVGRFIEEDISNERRVFIEVYKVSDGYVLWNDWEFVSVDADTPERVQEIIEEMQDTWIELAYDFATSPSK
jgi:hypothetical protein